MNSDSTNKASNQMKNMFENLKSRYILQKLFGNLGRKKLLDVIKYNENIKKRININIDDYKEYLSIEIEIIPKMNEYCKIININDDEKYYHIYFNDNKEEIKRNYINENDRVRKIKIILDSEIKSFSKLFYWCECIESINFKNFLRKNITDMDDMFCRCSSLKELNLKNFNTNNVINMKDIFYRCSSLKKLNLNNFNTINVINMSYMFNGCSSLKKLNLNNFNTINVTNMSYMFYRCSSLKELNLNNFNTNNVTNMSYMFYGCSSLKQLNLNNFNTINVTNMTYMFSECSDELKKKIKAKYKNIREEAFI